MINSVYKLKPFESPQNETSLWKNIPICELRNVQKLLRTTFPEVGRAGNRFLYRFRGVRTQRGSLSRQQTCHLKDANRFSVYIAGGS